MRLGIVEDNQTLAEVLRFVCKEIPGYSVEFVAYEASQARSVIASQGSPEVLLLDLGLPDMDGSEFAKEVVSKYPSVKVVVMTAVFDEKIRNTLAQVGVHRFMDKRAEFLAKLPILLKELAS